MDLEQQIEALLFFKGEPVKIKELSKILEQNEDSINESLVKLSGSLKERGVRVLIKDNEALLVTSPEVSGIIESARKEELSRDIGKAGLETLSIVLYKGPVARSEIDYIRGVNSTFILRNLLIKGLVERIANPRDQRSFLYRPSFDLLTFLGISNIEELPDFEKVKEELETFVQSHTEENGDGDATTTTE